MFSIIRQLEEKNVANEIDILLWSDRMDLVAFSNIKGEVSLHRLTWTRVWSLAPNKEGNLVKAMAWRPDGKILAVGYSSGQILLINVEDKSTIHSMDIPGEISCITWIQEKNKNKNTKKLLVDNEEHNNYTQYIDHSSTFLPEPPSLSSYSTLGGHDDSISDNFFQNQTDLNLLAVGTSDGILHLSIFGCFSCATININEILETKCKILQVYLSEALDKTYVSIQDDSGFIKLVVLNTEIFSTHIKELFCIALKHQQIKSLLTYLSNAISSIKETWESILLEMDSKLSKYAAKIPNGTLSADFLDLLMFGICSDEMQEFLLQDLTKKGLEKFGHTIEMNYDNIQKLLLKNVTKVAQHLTYHLAELRGMARLEHRYNPLGLDETKITAAISSNGSFLIKSGEMQQIINNSMLYYKAFFRWLYTAIIHLIYETVPPEIPKMTQQDLAYITEFLQNFDEIAGQNNTTIGGSQKSGFIMERLGQYLADSCLSILPNMEHNEWDNFVSQNECIRKNPGVIQHYQEKSLVQQFKHLTGALDEIFAKPQSLISKDIKLQRIITCAKTNPPVSIINSSSGYPLYVFLPNKPTPDSFYLLDLEASKAAEIHITLKVTKYLISDLKFFTENILSVLLQDPITKLSSLFQCPTIILREKLSAVDLSRSIDEQEVAVVDGNGDGQGVFKGVNMVASKFAVSGFRRVSIVLSENGKKVMLFEMEGEEEEEEEDAEMTTSTVRESDVSMQEASDAE